MNVDVEPVQIKTILVAVDGSEFSDKAVRHACALGQAMDAEVILLYVVPMLVSATPYGDVTSDQPFLALQKVGEDIMARAKNMASKLGCTVVDLIDHGDPARRIVDMADERSVDLILIGSLGVSGFKRLFTGSTSDKVAKNARCPVMIVR
ncbi:MAG: universal stress protein [Candidatus Thorarchaeota archaeon]|nr:MAG: universal stress protein [Candidatus Thorarchaeota archaeon]